MPRHCCRGTFWAAVAMGPILCLPPQPVLGAESETARVEKAIRLRWEGHFQEAIQALTPLAAQLEKKYGSG
ncbi:MAG: hypothetical protein K8T91_05595 [Planctomycetes bacterium]|nr:hypothetical protein [Planctomycetota bacterium]